MGDRVTRDWNMPRATAACAACGRPFEVGRPFVACLYETESGYERQDYCSECPPPSDPPPLGQWRTQRPEPAARRRPALDREAVRVLFERLEDSDRPEHVQFRFLLALLLWRMRVLKLERAADDATPPFWEFREPATERTSRVRRPDLADDELERLSSQLEALLSGKTVAADLAVPDVPGESAND